MLKKTTQKTKKKGNNTETLWLAMKQEKYIFKKNSEPIYTSTCRIIENHKMFVKSFFSHFTKVLSECFRYQLTTSDTHTFNTASYMILCLVLCYIGLLCLANQLAPQKMGGHIHGPVQGNCIVHALQKH